MRHKMSLCVEAFTGEWLRFDATLHARSGMAIHRLHEQTYHFKALSEESILSSIHAGMPAASGQMPSTSSRRSSIHQSAKAAHLVAWTRNHNRGNESSRRRSNCEPIDSSFTKGKKARGRQFWANLLQTGMSHAHLNATIPKPWLHWRTASRRRRCLVCARGRVSLAVNQTCQRRHRRNDLAQWPSMPIASSRHLESSVAW